jgi:Ca-activated chloride channel family protein
MNFHWPLVLWALLIPSLWLTRDLFRSRRHKSTTAASPSKIIQAEATRSSLVIGHWSFQRGLSKPRWRFCLGLAAAIIALARPQWGRIEEPIFDQSREILLALDLSRSMTAPDVKPNRLDRAKLLITSLLERLEGERVGLVVFAGTSFLQSPLSADYEILRDFLPALNPDFLPQGGSNYRALLETSLEAFGTSDTADRYLIILSDGEATDDNWRPLADELKKKSIRAIGLGIGTLEGAMIPDGSGAFVKDERGAVVLSKLESRTLQQLAETTSGTYTDASAWVDLAQLIETTVETGRKGAFLERNRVRLAERFQWVLAPALLLLAWSYWREFPVRPRSRDIQLKIAPPPPLPTAVGGVSPPRATVANLLILGFTLAPLVTGHWSFAAEAPSAATSPDPATAIAAPLSTLVGHFSGKDTLAARDCAQIANTTLTYGERLQSAKHPVPEGPIRDALLAVDQGEAADAKAADWPDLRAKLRKLLEKPQEPPKQDQDKKQDEKQNPQEKKDQQNQQDKQDPKNQSGKPDDKSEQEKKDQQEKSDPQQSQDSSKSPQNQQRQQDSKPGEEKKDPPKEQQSAFGKMDKPPEEKTSQEVPQSSEETQKIGGTPENKSTVPANPELSVPLQKLDQVRNLDSPGRLFQLMQDPKAKPEKPGKDW